MLFFVSHVLQELGTHEIGSLLTAETIDPEAFANSTLVVSQQAACFRSLPTKVRRP
jgi:hypothetical protein